ncbi:hypothetical protein HDU76_014083, partial [Blyttiomyces sp. JEL0837]
MRGSDVWILRWDQVSKGYYIQDSFASDFQRPEADVSQDVVLVSPPVNSNTSTVYTFQRQLSTCDSSDLEIKMGVTSNIIWAYGSTSVSSSISQHSPNNRGNAKVLFYPDPNAVDSGNMLASKDVSTIDIRMPNFTIPPVETSYYCSHFELPADQKYHVVGFEGLPSSNPPTAPLKNGDLYDCKAMETQCTENMFLWAPGTPPVQYPVEAGMAVGSGENARRTVTHMHTLGNVQTVQHIRGINEIEPITMRKHYDFNYQAPVTLQKTIMMPGDAFITTCGYLPSAGKRTNATHFGESTQSEMCLNFITYYPKFKDVEVCMSDSKVKMGLCTTLKKLGENGLSDLVNTMNSTGDIVKTVTDMIDNGDLVTSVMPTYNSWNPTCLTSVQALTAPPKTSGATMRNAISVMPYGSLIVG